MKDYSNKGAMIARKHLHWTQFSVLFMLIGALACTQPALAQASVIGEWQEAPPVDGDDTWPLKAVHASLMPDGQILTWEGAGASARLWDTRSGAFTCMPINTSTLFCSGHASLADGSLLIAGGGFNFGSNQTIIYRHGSVLSGGPWEIKDTMEYGRWYPTCTTLGDGSVLTVAGLIGLIPPDPPYEHATYPEIYDPDIDMWETLSFAEKQLPLYPYMFLLKNGRVFFAGPGQATYVLDLTELPDPIWVLDSIDAVYAAVDGAAVMYEPGKIVRIGGSTGGTPRNNVELIDFDDPTPAWSDASSMSIARVDLQSVLLADGTVFVIGGKDSEGVETKRTELYDPATNSWADMADTTYFRYYHSSALLLPDGRVLSAGGNECNNNSYSNDCSCCHSRECPAELFAPPYLFAGQRPVVGYAPSSVSYASDFAVTLSTSSQIVTSAIAKVSLIRPGSMTHNFDQNQRYVPLNFQVRDEFTLSVEAPLNGNIAPPGYYMLFVISGAGVPSEAKFVQLQ